MCETEIERKYREALEKTRNRLDYLEELYVDMEGCSEFYELRGLVEKGLITDTSSSTDKISAEELQEQLNCKEMSLTEPQRFNFGLSQLVPDSNSWLVSHDDYQKLKVNKEILKKSMIEIDR